MINSKLNKQDKEMLREEFTKVWGNDSKMVDWCVKKTSAYMEIDGHIITLDKPNIQTRFCFGYGVQGGYDYDEAQQVRDSLSQSERYFIDYNLSHSDAGELMESIEDHFWTEYWFDPSHYTTQSDDCRISAIRLHHRHDHEWCERQGWRLLTDDELHEYYQMCFEEQMKFCKRLKTYLKRYGLSKCDYWTYWVDE